MPEVRVRAATPADAGEVGILVELAYAPYVGRIGRRPAPMDQDYRAVLLVGTGWVAELDGRIAGVAIAVPRPTSLLLDNLAVDPEVQGTGIGERLLAEVERHALALGLHRIDLYTNEAMTENLAYYERRGYRETARAEEDGFRRVYLSRMLPAAP
ncbi:GNAT family N-acetyltransferase [Naasia aerilata]|uniref:GNAT family N-acetyltransferase n=1 Tax=Naasia aerilata TaxID=1162966 RepID=UPI0025727A1C|nr:GNAT family N-acetyltransferase [Naasia aerilata]